MSVLVFVEIKDKLTKAVKEAVTYGKNLGNVTLLTYGDVSDSLLLETGNFGVENILICRSLKERNEQLLTKLIVLAVKEQNFEYIVLSQDQTGKAVAPRVAANLEAGHISGAIELVVSAGRGLKGPENWGIVEELANSLGATTACSRPVADIGWRPHHEHVGQTGVAIRPNLYIAAGISGAIQHLAGVNGSKVIVVINTDPEAPFFKAADYGIVGDAFEVLPRLTSAINNFKSSQ